MAKFEYKDLMDRLSKELGIHLFLDYGTIEGGHSPYRVINEIVTPIVGVFRLNPTPLTALKSPYIAVTTATLDIPAPSEKVEEVRDKLNDLAARKNATCEKIRRGDTNYTVVYSFETAVIGDRRRDVSMYNGEIIPVTQVITYTIVESGVSCFDVALRIDGHDVPILTMQETRTAASETAPDAHAKGRVSITQELYGVTLTTPAVENALGELLRGMVDDGNGNTVHAVEVEKSGLSKVYMMTVGTSGATVQPPNNVGYSLSLAEIDAKTAKFNGLWSQKTLTGLMVTYSANGGIFWGDGTGDRINGSLTHTYTDGKTIHTALILSYGNTERWGVIKKGNKLNGVAIKPAQGMVVTSALPETVLTMDSGDSLHIDGNRLKMTVDGNSFAVDSLTTLGYYALQTAFTSLLRGSVATVNTDLLVYDRWAVAREV